MVFEKLLDPILSPLLFLPALVGLGLLALLISVIITLIQKYTTNQVRMKELKDELKASQKKMKESKNNPEQMLKHQREMMSKNMEYMKHSMRSALFSFLPLILIFAWMQSHFAYVPILPNQEFTTTIQVAPSVTGTATLNTVEGVQLISDPIATISSSKATWKLKGDAGEYLLEYEVGGGKYSKSVMIDPMRYMNPVDKVKDGTVEMITVDQPKRILIPLFGGMGWLITYILLSLAFGLGVRKIIKVY